VFFYVSWFALSFERVDLSECCLLPRLSCVPRCCVAFFERRLGMGPGSIGPAITVMQPDGADDEKIWRKFGETHASQKKPLSHPTRTRRPD
jgi:hypothetical protein